VGTWGTKFTLPSSTTGKIKLGLAFDFYTMVGKNQNFRLSITVSLPISYGEGIKLTKPRDARRLPETNMT